MFISPSSLTLNSFPTGSRPATITSAAAFSFLDLQPLSTPFPPPNQFSIQSHTYSSPNFRSPPPSELPTPMSSGVVAHSYYSGGLGAIVLSSSSSPSIPSISAPEPITDTGTSTGTNLPPPPNISSNSNILPALSPRSAASRTTLSSAFMSSPSLSHSTNPSSTSGFPFTPTFTPPFPITPHTQNPSLPATVSLYSPSHSTGSPLPTLSVSTLSSLPSTSLVNDKSSAVPEPTTAVVFSTTVVTSISLYSSSASTYTVTSVLPGQGRTTTDFVTTSSVLSTEPPGSAINSTVSFSPGTIVAIVLGVIGALAFSALWLFCARRRHQKLLQEAALIQPVNHTSGPLDDEILDADELGYGIGSTHSAENPTSRTGQRMEERYAAILAALHSTEGFGRGNEEGSTGGVYGSRHDIVSDIDGNDGITRTSSPTLPLHVLPPDDPPYIVPLSPPPPFTQPLHHQITQPIPPPSSYYMASRRKSSPGPDSAPWFGGYSSAPSYSSHYARSQTLGSGSGSADALTRTRTGSEEPLLGIGKVAPEVSSGVSTPGGVSPTTITDQGGSRPGLGSAFGSPATSIYSPSAIYPAFQYDTSGSHDTRTVSGSGSYGYTRSGTPSSFDVLRSVSSQGALSSTYSQGHGQSQGFRFGFSRQGSLSSSSTGKKPKNDKHSFGIPPSTFKAWKDWGSAASEKEKQGEMPSIREGEWGSRPQSWTSTSASGSADEKQGRGSPASGVRALLGRLRRAGHTSSPHSSNVDLPSPIKASMDVDPAADQVTPPPIQIEAVTPQRRRLSFILSNPDSHPLSLYSGIGNVTQSPDTAPRQGLLPVQYSMPACDPADLKLVPSGAERLQPAILPFGYVAASAPSPVPTEESRLAEGLLHPRLQTQECSGTSLRDFEDYSRPIGGVVKNRLHSTTTFGTQDEADRTPSQGTPVQDVVAVDEHETVDAFGTSTLSGLARDSWLADDTSLMTAHHSPGGT